MQTEKVVPNIGNFIKSLRDVGYSFEIAVADIIDNCISASASKVKIYTVAEPEIILAILDNGLGMTNTELVEAMRLATKNPEDKREKNDLGRFGIGLKTASFSQCKRLTVISKKENKISAKQWDIDFISKRNEWLLISINNFEYLPLYDELKTQSNGTLVVWENLDRFQKQNYSDNIDRLRKHLALVFHRFLDGSAVFKRLELLINDNPVKPFNPFNSEHPATQCLAEEKIKLFDSEVTVVPFILPHHSKISQQEYEQYSTEEGYTKSQGFYLYRANRLLIYGTWWGMHKAVDAHKLVRVKIDIPNSNDHLWGIDIKKSAAVPVNEIRNDLKRIIKLITEKGSRPFTGRGKKIKDNAVNRFWHLIPFNGDFRFILNLAHPLYDRLISGLSQDNLEKLEIYLKGLQAYLPLEAIQAQLQQNPHQIKQETILTKQDLENLVLKLKSAGFGQDYIESLLKTEIFKNNQELLIDE
ncbi:MAG: ATP-binding protein [Melioribacteraceae bacterium]|nr:ATP-binding protein [Melioribacteraceae bacterium]